MMETRDKPLVSVVMATYNEPAGIVKQSVQSILDQSYPHFELIILDDSTDPGTLAAIDELACDPRISVVRDTKRIGFVKALNLGLNNARGKYIARMDGDDVAVKDRLEKQVAFLENNSVYSLVGGAMNIIDEDGRVKSHRSYPASSLKLNAWSVFRSPLAHPAVMMRREIIDAGFRYDENFKKSEDLEFWLRLMKNGYRIYNLSDTLLNFRVIGKLGNKRNSEHFRYNLKARYKNFSWKSPLRSTLSLCISLTYLLLPRFIINKIYALENKKVPQKQ